MEIIQKIKEEIQKIVVGHEKLIDSMLLALITDSHLLIEGVPGIAKTTSVNTLSKTVNLDFKRVQFTPDLLPSDITGIEIFNPKTDEFETKKGPAFTNLLLADEINRAPAKVQSALLEVMQERQVTIGNNTYKIDEPFLVIATQNPIEEEGTYPLPAAQLDRFLMKIVIGYNSFEEEMEIIKRLDLKKEVKKVADKEDILALRDKIKEIHMDEEVLKYIVKIVEATRSPEKYNINIEEYIDYGASPRATISLFNAARAYAMIQNKDYVTPLDIAKLAPDILRHRLVLSYKAEIDEINEDKIIGKILKSIPLP
ncbi:MULTISPECIES: AAA family ATPase [unclassified Lebetimonas]|uniref:AAA family ATPase n=1 Tax=unclassified Lebetimonas TaxID=2648158 RepID=UPI000465E66F|nr:MULTISPECIES: MoxR family ATPase [unclassified Lebetimonas]